MVRLQKFYGNMDWWDVAEQPPASSNLYKKINKYKSLWEANQANQKSIIDELNKFLKSKFLIENIENYESIFDTRALKGDLEVPADKVVIVDLDFSTSPLPKCKSEAFFTLPMKGKSGEVDFDEWQENNSPLHDAITFYWDFGTELALDLDLSFGSHSGVECIPID